MKISLHPFITGCAFCLYGLISGNAYAQTFALEAGAELVYRPSNMPRLKFFTNGYYAPHALTFSQGRNVAMQSVNADYRLSAHSAFRIGYRRIKMVLNNGIITDFNRGVYLGLLWNF